LLLRSGELRPVAAALPHNSITSAVLLLLCHRDCACFTGTHWFACGALQNKIHGEFGSIAPGCLLQLLLFYPHYTHGCNSVINKAFKSPGGMSGHLFWLALVPLPATAHGLSLAQTAARLTQQVGMVSGFVRSTRMTIFLLAQHRQCVQCALPSLL
jgi:hypothetical protein